jgi:hypothetical protein
MSIVTSVLTLIVDHVCVSDIPELIVEYADDGFCYLDQFELSTMYSSKTVILGRKHSGKSFFAAKIQKQLSRITRWVVFCTSYEKYKYESHPNTFVHYNLDDLQMEKIEKYTKFHDTFHHGVIFDNIIGNLYNYLDAIRQLECTVIFVSEFLVPADRVILLSLSPSQIERVNQLLKPLPAETDTDKPLVYEKELNEFFKF